MSLLSELCQFFAFRMEGPEVHSVILNPALPRSFQLVVVIRNYLSVQQQPEKASKVLGINGRRSESKTEAPSGCSVASWHPAAGCWARCPLLRLTRDALESKTTLVRERSSCRGRE